MTEPEIQLILCDSRVPCGSSPLCNPTFMRGGILSSLNAFILELACRGKTQLCYLPTMQPLTSYLFPGSQFQSKKGDNNCSFCYEVGEVVYIKAVMRLEKLYT